MDDSSRSAHVTTSVLERNRDEEQRVAALHEYGLLDQPADDELSAVVRVAAVVAGVPTATLNLIDENRQCQLTTVGFQGGDSKRTDSMCAIQFRAGVLVHLSDASADPLYRDNPWVTGKFANVRFYASAPLVTPDGYALGTLCVFDDKVKRLDSDQVQRLLDLAGIIVALFERRRQARAYAELAAERERESTFIETVLETIDVGVVVADAEGRVTHFNRAAREWHGIGADPDLAPADFSDRYGLFDADGTRKLTEDEIPLLRGLREGRVSDVEIMIKRPGADPLELTCNATSLVSDDGTLLGAVVVMSNVTEDRSHLRALEKAHRALAERGEQLTDAVTELRRSNDELEQFAGAVSHDLVRPMAAAHGYLELLSAGYGGTLDERAGTWLDAAIRAVQRMQQLVQALLTYARSGQAPYQPRPVRLTEVLGNVLDDLRTITETSQAEIVTPRELPTVLGDPTLLRQLLQNLVDNAMKYRCPDRTCRITISAERDGNRWTLLVADNGIGIPADQRDRVFEMFAQVNPEARKGHGIGLSTCHRIMERHGGAITITDTPGGGVTMRVSLPAADPPDAPADRRT